jgi:hypothetical protein
VPSLKVDFFKLHRVARQVKSALLTYGIRMPSWTFWTIDSAAPLLVRERRYNGSASVMNGPRLTQRASIALNRFAIAARCGPL